VRKERKTKIEEGGKGNAEGGKQVRKDSRKVETKEHEKRERRIEKPKKLNPTL
jgi:hypothetical protein